MVSGSLTLLYFLLGFHGAVSIRHPLFRQNQNGTRAVQISDTLLGGAQMISDTLLVGAQMSRGLLLVGA